MALNQAQMEAVSHKDGPMMVLAGPGSGKTTVITKRIQYLTGEHHVEPSGILVITFTRAAANEMKERYEKMLEKSSAGKAEKTSGRVSFGTFHSVFFRILKLAYRYEAENIVKEEDRLQFFRETVNRMELEVEDENEFISSIISEISMVKGEMMDLTHYYSKNCSEEVFKEIYASYEQWLRKRGLLDFDDMMTLCYELFQARKDILGAWQKKYQYILIDEFQDINRIQYEIIRMMALPENNLFIVGDDDQSIYRFRGARPEIMLGFERDYPDAKRTLLNINYRSSRQIVEAAGRVIVHNEARFPKEIFTKKGDGKPVITEIFPTPLEETRRIASEIRDYVKMGVPYNQIAVLYRTNMGPGLLMEKLMEYNIPFVMQDKVPNLYEHWIAKNIISYIIIAAGHLERARVMEIINRPKRYISRDALDSPKVNWESVKSFYQDKDWMVERIERLQYDLEAIAGMIPAAAVNYIRKAIGYDEYIREYAEFRRMKPEELYEILDQLQESAAGFRTFADWFRHMKEYKEQLLLQAQSKEKQIDGVALMTMHSSKGLEYQVVYILDANEGVTPHNKAAVRADMEEERRMFYVAMTRAKERLHVYAVRERYHKRQELSRFVREYLEGGKG